MAIANPLVPLPLSGNITEQQHKLLLKLLMDAAQTVFGRTVEQVDRQTAQLLLEADDKLKKEITRLMVDTIERNMVSDKFKDEEVGSNRVYPHNYRVRYIEDQVEDLRRTFPILGNCREKLARSDLPDEAEGWFAIPRWQALAHTYNEAVELVLDEVASRRRFANRIAGRLGPAYLRQTERSKLADRLLAEHQPGCDILVVAAQAGMLHRGSSARRTRVAMAPNEFGMGVFTFTCMLLTHPERLSSPDTLMVDCGGDEYSVLGRDTFDRVPLFDYDLSGIEFSVFYDDRARNLWGTPTGFLYQLG
jgi:hypothetical protein